MVETADGWMDPLPDTFREKEKRSEKDSRKETPFILADRAEETQGVWPLENLVGNRAGGSVRLGPS